MKTRDRLRLAIAGAGMVTHHHLIAWSRVARAVVITIQNRTLERAQKREAKFGIPKVYSDLKEMLDKEKPDVPDIAAAMEVHAEIARIAANFGVDILCQKPMAPTLSESEALVAEIRDRVRFMVHENWRFRPHFRQSAAWIKRQPFLARLKRFIFLEFLIHHLDTARFLIGPLKVTGCHTQCISAEVMGEDMAVILRESENGTVGTVSGNMSATGFPPLSQDRLELIGEKASIIVEGDCLRLIGEGEMTMCFDLADAYQKSYNDAIAHFVEALRSGRPFETDCQDNLQILKLVDEAYKKAGL